MLGSPQGVIHQTRVSEMKSTGIGPTCVKIGMKIEEYGEYIKTNPQNCTSSLQKLILIRITRFVKSDKFLEIVWENFGFDKTQDPTI